MKTTKILVIIGASLLLASCASKRSPLTYFENIDTTQVIEIERGAYNIKIEPSDELLITVTSENPEVTANYNIPLVNPATNANLLINTTPRQQTFIVDSKGYINYPSLGRLRVEGLTVEQLQDLIMDKIKADVVDPIVKVELVNFTVNVAGEVKEPGQINVTKPRFTVLDALTAVGDLTPYGERDNVLVVREIDGKRVSQRLNLNDAKTLQSPFFYVKQNDYIYVEPNKIRKDNSEYNQNNSYKLSVVSTIVSGCSVVASLIIALTR